MHAIEVVAEKLQLSIEIVERLIQLIEVQECTIPFIARYRREQTSNMDADMLRIFLETLKEIREVEKKADMMMNKIKKQGRLDDEIENSLKSAQSMDELNLLIAPYKGDSKHSLADRARVLGLEEPTLILLKQPTQRVSLRNWVKKGTEGLATLSEVEKGVKHLIADHIAKHPDTLQSIRKIFHLSGITLHSKQSTAKMKDIKNNQNKSFKNSVSNNKYKIYYDFQCRVEKLKSYQILALNRGEAQKELTVKLLIDINVEEKFFEWTRQRWLNPICFSETKEMVEICIQDSYKRLIKPLVLRRVRSDLTKSARLASVEVFRRNLKKLLLTAPVRDKIVLGVDPGFTHGCKCAVISANGNDILDTTVIYLNNKKKSMDQIKALHKKFYFEIVAIGNGTACRETEQLFSELIQFHKDFNVLYCIVNENGASIYSVTEEAQKEMPDLDPNLRSAVSIARRLQDPLVELVKIDPKHLGIGMYQHDLPESLLKASLDDVVEDCVTFVGADLNVAGPSLLRRIAGLKASQVDKIIRWREKHGGFVNRKQLLNVPGIGANTFKQCAGFVRISPSTSCKTGLISEETSSETRLVGRGRKRRVYGENSKSSKKRKLSDELPDFLDQTWIHPESYEVTRRFLSLIKCCDSDIGNADFISKVQATKRQLDHYVCELSVSKPTLELIIDGLSQPCGYCDFRKESSSPLYRRGVKSMVHVRFGDVLKGRVTNVTDFGVFADVGVGQDGLIHFSKIQNWDKVKEDVGPNDRVNVSVLSASPKLSFNLISFESCHTVLR